MSDDLTPDENEPQEPRGLRAQLEAEQKARRESEARLAELERKAAFAEALGPKLSEPWAKFFTKGYDGDLTPDAIRDEATKAGFLPAEGTPAPQPEAQPTPQVDPALQQIAQMSAAAQGASAPALPSTYADDVAAAKTKAELDEVMRRYRPDDFKPGAFGV